ncbi:MAG: NERD domain-containing protein [Pseudomonadota bacterium]|nr:NERD domain-containing protein [Pseudomonadota bacterium]
MTRIGIDPQWLWIGALLLAVAAGAFWGFRLYQRRARRRALLLRLERIAFDAAHQVLVPDGMGGFIHVDHLLLTPRGVLVLDTRRIQGLIFGGDQMSDWTVIGGGRRYTFDNPQPALYDRIAAVKALVGDLPVEGRLLFSNVGKFTKGIPKWVLMLDGIEVEFPVVDRAMSTAASFAPHAETWRRLVGQLRPSPHLFTSL